MTYYFDPILALWMLAGLILGLLIGRLTWGRAARRHARAAENVGNAATAAAARTQIEHNERELAAVQASIRPLADEVDRLKRELAKAKRPIEPPLPGAAVRPDADARPEPRASEASPVMPLTDAIAGTGPIVVGEGNSGVSAGSAGANMGGANASADGAAGAVPGIRQLKGVGNNLAAALEAIGLNSIDSIARLTGDEAIEADGRLGVFNGRIAKDRLVEQAVLLDEGRTTEYATRFGRIGGPVLI